MPNKKIIIALAGNPNSGKTTIFNNLTGARQKVGNWGGVTVEKKEGTLKSDDYEINIMDLPGTYSLTAYSIEEIVARNYIIDEKPDIIVNIVDSSNLERNLYLTTQLIDLGVPVVIALNMYDELEAKGITIDIKTMSRILGIPIIPTIGKHNKGTKELIEEIIKVYEQKEPVSRHTRINYGDEVEKEILKIQTELDGKINAATPMTDNKLVKSVGTSGIDVEATGIDVDDSNNVTGVNDLIIEMEHLTMQMMTRLRRQVK